MKISEEQLHTYLLEAFMRGLRQEKAESFSIFFAEILEEHLEDN